MTRRMTLRLHPLFAPQTTSSLGTEDLPPTVVRHQNPFGSDEVTVRGLPTLLDDDDDAVDPARNGLGADPY